MASVLECSIVLFQLKFSSQLDGDTAGCEPTLCSTVNRGIASAKLSYMGTEERCIMSSTIPFFGETADAVSN